MKLLSSMTLRLMKLPGAFVNEIQLQGRQGTKKQGRNDIGKKETLDRPRQERIISFFLDGDNMLKR
jgi:hypothetical protein